MKMVGNRKLWTEYAILYNHSLNYNIKSLRHYKSQLHKFKSQEHMFLKINILHKSNIFSSTFFNHEPQLIDT